MELQPTVPQEHVVANRTLPKEDAEQLMILMMRLDAFVANSFPKVNKMQLTEFTPALRRKCRDFWLKDHQIIDLFIQYAKLSPEEADIARQWKQGVSDRFLCIEYTHDNAILYAQNYYPIKALTEDFEKIISYQPPFFVETLIVPYKQYLVWDGIIAVQPAQLPAEFVTYLKDGYKFLNS